MYNRIMKNKNTQKKAYSYIRFSSAIQAKGDSLRRQSDASNAWAEANGYSIIENLTDMGLSAYKGKHTSEGALGIFLEKVNEGNIEEGSVLLVESLDRLSRQEIVKALSQFLGIISAGIKVVTLIDGYEYTRDSINDIGNLMYSLMIMHRAYEESHTKSKRLLAAWDNKIKNAENKPVTSRSPLWIKFNRGSRSFELIPERAEIIRMIFERSIAGHGKRAIARHLNSSGVRTWNKGKIWYDSYIQKILENRSTYGVYIPHRRQKKEHEVEGYYPAAVDKETFFRAQALRQARQLKGGRRSSGFGNLFMHLCRCMNCGGAMVYINKGKPPKGGKYLKCKVAHLDGECSSDKSWRYEPLETALLMHLAKRVNWFSFINNTQSDTDALKEERFAVNAELIDVENTLNNYEKIIPELDSSATIRIAKKYNETVNKLEALQSRLDTLDSEILEESHSNKDIQNELNAALVKLDLVKDDEEDFEYRLQINKLLKGALKHIWFDSDKDMIAYRMKDSSFHALSVSKDHLESVQETAYLDKFIRLLEGYGNEIAKLEQEIIDLDKERDL